RDARRRHLPLLLGHARAGREARRPRPARPVGRDVGGERPDRRARALPPRPRGARPGRARSAQTAARPVAPVMPSGERQGASVAYATSFIPHYAVLVLVPPPIGNVEVISLRALSELQENDLVT